MAADLLKYKFKDCSSADGVIVQKVVFDLGDLCSSPRHLHRLTSIVYFFTLYILDLVSTSKIYPFFAFLITNYGALYHSIKLNLGMPQGISGYFDHQKIQH